MQPRYIDPEGNPVDQFGMPLMSSATPTAPKESGGIGGLALDLMPFGRQLEKLYTGRANEISPGEVAGEGLLSLIPFGIGKAAKVGKGILKGAKGLKNFSGKGADILKTADTVPTKNLTSYEGAPDLAQVDKYKQMIQSGQPVDPIKVLKDSTGKLGVEDGKHRLEAYKQLGIPDIPVEGPAAKALGEIRPVGALSRVAERLMGKQTGIVPGSKVGSQELTAERSKQLQEHIKNIGARPTDAADTILRRNEAFLRNQEQRINAVLDAKNAPLASSAAEDILRAGKPPLGVDLATNDTYKSLSGELGNVKDLKGLENLRRGIDDIINFSRSAASPDPVSERVALSFRQAINDYMGNKVPDLKPLKAAYSKGKDVETFIRPAATKPGGFGAFGVNVGGRALQSLSGSAGRSLETMGPAAAGAASMLAMPLQQAGTRVGADLLGAREYANVFQDQPASPEASMASSPIDMQMDASTMLSGSSGQSMAPQNNQELLRQALQIAALQALAKGDYKGIEAISTASSLIPKEKTSKEDAKLSNASKTLDQLEGLYSKAGGGQGLLGYGSKALASARLSPDVEAYNNLRKSAAVSLARAFGEVGALSNQDIEMYAKMIPDVTSSGEAAATQFAALRERLDTAQPVGSGQAAQILQQYGL